MTFTQKDLARQREEISRLSKELSALNVQFEKQQKAAKQAAAANAGIDDANCPPELKAAIVTARKKAQQAGQESAARLKEALTSEQASNTSLSSRRGTLRV